MDTLHSQTDPTAKPPKSRKTVGRISLCLSAASAAALIVTALRLLLAYRSGGLSGTLVAFSLTAVRISAGIAAAAAVAAFVAFFLRSQKKAAAVCALILSLLLLCADTAGLYGYSYVFGKMQHDDALNALSNEDLYAAGQKEDGEIIRSTVPTDATLPSDSLLPSQPDMEEIQWMDYTYDQVPYDARLHLDSVPPTNPCYLLEGSEDISMFMIFGLDKIESSDAMILFAVDRPHQKLKMISLARDTYACYPEWGPTGYTRLAYPYTYGGVQGELSTINHNFSLNITDYVSANFDQLIDLVDFVGGVDVDINDYEYSHLAYRFYGITTGMNHLDGEAALAYARIRNANDNGYFEGEVQRTGRQREVISSILTSIKDMHLADFPAFIRNCLGMCTTSLTQQEILDIALEVAQGNYTIESYALVNEIDHWEGFFGPLDYFYYVYDFNRASDWIYRTVYEEFYVSGYEDLPEVSE